MKRKFLIFVFLLSEMYISCNRIKGEPRQVSWKDRAKNFFRRRSNRVAVAPMVGVRIFSVAAPLVTAPRHGDKEASLQELCMRQMYKMSDKSELVGIITQQVPEPLVIVMASYVRKKMMLTHTQQIQLLSGLVASSSGLHGQKLAQWVEEDLKKTAYKYWSEGQEQESYGYLSFEYPRGWLAELVEKSGIKNQ